MFEALLKYLDRLEFKSRPSYDFFRKAFKLIMVARNYKEEGPFDWEIIPRNVGVSFTAFTVSTIQKCPISECTQASFGISEGCL